MEAEEDGSDDRKPSDSKRAKLTKEDDDGDDLGSDDSDSSDKKPSARTTDSDSKSPRKRGKEKSNHALRWVRPI